jgi:hypothetical protein
MQIYIFKSETRKGLHAFAVVERLDHRTGDE